MSEQGWSNVATRRAVQLLVNDKEGYRFASHGSWASARDRVQVLWAGSRAWTKEEAQEWRTVAWDEIAEYLSIELQAPTDAKCSDMPLHTQREVYSAGRRTALSSTKDRVDLTQFIVGHQQQIATTPKHEYCYWSSRGWLAGAAELGYPVWKDGE
jgi:hypothetical protein